MTTTNSGASAMQAQRTPSCPNCGQLATEYTRYTEGDGTFPVISNSLTRLMWTCLACGQSVTITAQLLREPATPTEAVPVEEG